MSADCAATAPNLTATPEAAADAQSGRTAKGRFAHGNPGGPGRPPKVEYIEREVVAIMASALDAETWFKIAEAVIKKALEGNMTAVQWLSKTFLTGKLNDAAAAQEVRIPPQVEMVELGRKQHHEWTYWLETKQAEVQRTARQNPVAQAAAYAVQQAAAARAATPAAASRPTPAPAAAQQTVAPADRVQGFRVTKGGVPVNGPNRSNTAENAGPAGPTMPR